LESFYGSVQLVSLRNQKSNDLVCGHPENISMGGPTWLPHCSSPAFLFSRLAATESYLNLSPEIQEFNAKW
jgi:hypothetical protein